jgi:small subunit ribosomal protein S17
MTEEETTEGQAPEEPTAETPDSTEEQPVEDAPETGVEEAPVEEAPDGPPPEPAAEAEPAAPAAEAAEPAEPEEQLGPKERRRRARSQHTGETRPARTPEERAADRDARRRKNAGTRARARANAKARRQAAGIEPGPARTPKSGEHGPGRPKVRQGVVISDKADKTITVQIDVTRRHRTYKKIVRSSSTLHAHDERNDANIGDTVRVVESRPLSRTKRWRLVEVLERAR